MHLRSPKATADAAPGAGRVSTTVCASHAHSEWSIHLARLVLPPPLYVSKACPKQRSQKAVRLRLHDVKRLVSARPLLEDVTAPASNANKLTRVGCSADQSRRLPLALEAATAEVATASAMQAVRLVAAARAQRPWQPGVEKVTA